MIKKIKDTKPQLIKTIRQLQRENKTLSKRMAEQMMSIATLMRDRRSAVGIKIENQRLTAMAEAERIHARKQYDKFIEVNRKLYRLRRRRRAAKK